MAKRRARGRHRRRREPRPCRGELLHLDGSPHEWLALCPGEQPTLIMSVDDATNEVLYAQLEPRETTAAIMRALRAVLHQQGIPMALYTDRASWAVVRQAGGAVDKRQLTQVGRALKRLGVEHIVAYSPQARGRSERMNGTWQGRLVNELRIAEIRTLAAANHYIRTRFLPRMNAEFQRTPADPTSAFVALDGYDLEQVLCHEEARSVAKDNTVSLAGVRLQLAKHPGRVSCAGLQVTVRRHLDGTHSIWRGLQLLGCYTADGQPLDAPRRRRQPPVGLGPPSGSPRLRRESESIERSVHLSN